MAPMRWQVWLPRSGRYRGDIHMAARIVRLRSKPTRLRAEQAQELRQMVLDFPGLPDHASGEIIAAIDRETAAENGWTFVMLSPAQNKAVQRWLVENSKRPHKATILWAELFDHLRRDTGEVMLTRDELAELVGCTADHVTEIMTELEGIGAISRRREGRGVRYFLNPNVATHLKGKVRDKAQAAWPPR